MIAVRFEGVSKKYSLGENVASIRELVAVLGQKIRGRKIPKKEAFWALSNISFEVKKGEAVGIIGRNGAGKSTILKMLSKITSPTEGKIYVRGKVSSLLELGTGFHPELTGRENIFLNGAILGMKKKEIRANIEKIIAFSEIAQHIDTPVKRYSSGMFLRLAFSIAVHLQTDIIVLDEILAVGDSEFQQKCKRKLQEIIASGKTVIVVSHDLPLIRYLCGRVILMDKGKKLGEGAPQEMIERYFSTQIPAQENAQNNAAEAFLPHFLQTSVVDLAGKPLHNVPDQTTAFLEFLVQNPASEKVILWVAIFNEDDLRLMAWLSIDKNIEIPVGKSCLRVKIPAEILKTGIYRVSAALYDNEKLFEQNDNIITFQRIVNKFYNFKQTTNNLHTVLEVDTDWSVTTL